MATLYVREYHSIGGGSNYVSQAAMEDGTPVDQTVAIGGASAQSAAFGSLTKLVRVQADSVCSVVFGANPTATTSNARMAAGATEYFSVLPGHKIAVIANT